MCPYCGEEVPQDSSKCWKCGTELSHDSSAAKGEGDELEVPDDEEEDDGKPVSLVECPYCGEPVNKKSIRCRECGRALQKVKSNAAAAALWKWGVWAVVLIVAVSSITAVVIYSQKRALMAERSAKAIGASFETLMSRLQPLSKGFKEERRREVWEKDFERRFVHWTDGKFQEFDPSTMKVKVTHGKKDKDKPDVIVTFLKDNNESLSRLQVGDTIEYSARLVGYGEEGFAFTLSDGMLDDKKDAK
jgi:predicted nucleic acid-binding Zn ribbon protein/Cu/Ag efflux protein CusF